MTIRRIPQDFLVEEELTPEFRAAIGPSPGRFAMFRLRKTSLTTPEAAGVLARGAEGASPAWGGLKDKHAVTVQHVSIRAISPPARVEGQGWLADLVGWSVAPMSPAAVAANRFSIVVRDLTQGAAEEMDRRAHFLAGPSGELLVANYFGDQRLGSARRGEGFAAARLIRGDFEGALRLLIGTPARKDSGKRRGFTRLLAGQWGDWGTLADTLPRCPERAAVEALARGGDFRAGFAALPYQLQNLCVEAYQSHLWNAAARRIFASIPGAIMADDAFGAMAFPAGAAIKSEWLSAGMPLWSPSTSLDEPWAGAMRAVLQDEGVTQDQLRIPGLRRPSFDEHPRRLFASASGFGMGAPEPDDLSSRGRLKRAINFRLPPGSFATVLLRAVGR